MIAAVVTYHPSDEQKRRIEALPCPVIVVDNTEDNRGIAWGLNEAARKAIEAGHEWLLTLDQDAHLTPNQFQDYMEAFSALDKSNMGAVAPITDSRVLVTGEAVDVLAVMTSGMIINLNAWVKVGGFTEKLFMDEVDAEFCLRLHLNGFRVVELRSVMIPHHPGEIRMITTAFGESPVAYHPPSRVYYIVRNYWYLRRNYSGHFPEIVAERKRNVIHKYKEHLRYHPGKIVAAYHLVRGTIHGMLGRYGK